MNKLSYGMAWFLTLSISFLITMMGILVATYAYVIFNSKHINSKLSVGNISAELSNFQHQIDTAINTNNELVKQNNQLLKRVDQFPVFVAGSNFDSSKNPSKEEFNKLIKLIQTQSNLLESQKSSLNLLNQDLFKLNAKVDKQKMNDE
ncbi:TPA: hypothetical protein OO122_003042 [Legionella pneumophila]|nr:hypothetical protein [Legionella pneumophila]HCR5132912.1 hypothetical protein [Legionella pneumophila]HCR5135959.1 hypothetical protein [Legionella pneumophila]HCR5139041.1 hypothetical protein [Legionella pneumophila]HCR5142096.1 hypothetical protein [Legionella pneumophila]